MNKKEETYQQQLYAMIQIQKSIVVKQKRLREQYYLSFVKIRLTKIKKLLYNLIFNMMDETAKLQEKLGPKIAKAITSIDGDGALKQAIDTLKGKGVSGEVIETVAEKKGLKGLQGYDDLLTKGVANETIEKLAKDGFDLDQVKELLDNGVHPNQYLEYGIKNSTEASWVNKFLKEGYALEDIKTLTKSGIDPSDYINKGITSPAIAKVVAEAKFDMRVIDEIGDSGLLNSISKFKSKLPAWAIERGNFGYAESAIEGISKNEYFAHSAIQTEIESVKGTGISIKSESTLLKAVEVNGDDIVGGANSWLRDVDTEFKILSEIQNQLGTRYNATGKIKLFTELKCCPSCEDVVRQFKRIYHNIDIEVIYKITK